MMTFRSLYAIMITDLHRCPECRRQIYRINSLAVNVCLNPACKIFNVKLKDRELMRIDNMGDN